MRQHHPIQAKVRSTTSLGQDNETHGDALDDLDHPGAGSRGGSANERPLIAVIAT
jgi:hypothetical protein